PPVPYSCSSVNVGLVTSSSAAACKPATIPLVNVVFPLPSSPDSSTSTVDASVSANVRPQAMVSSADCVITSSVTRLQLLHQFPARCRHRSCYFACQNAGFVALRAHQFGRSPVQIRSQRHHPVQIPRAKLGDQSREQSRKYVA